jgi:hypothetical protein
MSFAMVTVQTDSGDKVERALPLDVPARDLAAKIMRDLRRTAGTAEAFDFFIDTGHGNKLIRPTATLGEVGIVDGQRLWIKRAGPGIAPEASTAHAFLRMRNGAMLGLESNLVIIGRKDTQAEAPLDLDLSEHDPSNALSRRHACIGRQGTAYYLQDLESMNGTRVNEEDALPGRRMPLQDGDRIEFGRGVRVTFVMAKASQGKPGQHTRNT